jgi:hypothetical protein
MQSENKTNTTLVFPRSQADQDREWLRPVETKTETETDREWPRQTWTKTDREWPTLVETETDRDWSRPRPRVAEIGRDQDREWPRPRGSVSVYAQSTQSNYPKHQISNLFDCDRPRRYSHMNRIGYSKE